jgi:hypothetical protein
MISVPTGLRIVVATAPVDKRPQPGDVSNAVYLGIGVRLARLRWVPGVRSRQQQRPGLNP